MKSHPLSSYARIALVAAVAMLMSACAHTRNGYEPYPYHAPHATYYDYWYYPAVGSYYDTRTHYYIYYEHDRWVRARALPPHLRPHLGSHVTVRSPHDRPHEQHSRHREQYVPERYRKSSPGDRRNDVWLGPPRKDTPARARDDRNEGIQARDRHGKPSSRDGNAERVPAAILKDSRAHEPEHRPQKPPIRMPQAQKPNTRIRAAQDHREPPASAAPLRRETNAQGRKIRNEESRDRNGEGDLHRADGRGADAAVATSRTGRANPDAHDQRDVAEKPNKTARDHLSPDAVDADRVRASRM